MTPSLLNESSLDRTTTFCSQAQSAVLIPRKTKDGEFPLLFQSLCWLLRLLFM